MDGLEEKICMDFWMSGWRVLSQMGHGRVGFQGYVDVGDGVARYVYISSSGSSGCSGGHACLCVDRPGPGLSSLVEHLGD